ncbi:MAG: CBS domain-containing protein [Isosphaeraceae bacterium]|nr:CBS domain-containing protein [Isosphaeraceae bacterium]
MRESAQNRLSNALVLDASSAVELMTPDPISIHQDTALPEAVRLLMEKDISAVPVLDETGRPVGVLSRTDLVRYLHKEVWGRTLASSHGVSLAPSAPPGAAEHHAPAAPSVREVMTPAILSVPPTATAVEVVAHLLGLGNVHRVFVEDNAGVLIGVVSARDVLRKLHRPEVQ